MSRRNSLIAFVAGLVAGALVFGLFSVPRNVGAGSSATADRDDDAVAALNKRVAKLELEVTEIRKALLRAEGTPDSASESKHIREVAKLRADDLLQRTQNTRAVLRDVAGGKLAGRALLVKINDLNNDVTTLWLKIAGYGLGRDPYLDGIQVSDSGSGQPSPPPEYGITGPYASLGLPRLHEHFLAASGVKGKDAEKRHVEFKKLLEAYSNPAVYGHRDFNERAYADYRQGRGLDTPQYAADLKALDQWLTDLETVLRKVPEYFDKVP